MRHGNTETVAVYLTQSPRIIKHRMSCVDECISEMSA